MASRVSLIQSRSIYVGTANNVAPSDGNLIVTGNVGIGTTSPAYKLDVDSGGALVAARFYNSSYSATIVYIGDTGNSDYSDLILQSNSGTGEIFKAGTGYSGWGGTLALNIYNSNGAIAFHPNGIANAMFINTAGNVGIGTTSPISKLTVLAASTGYSSDSQIKISDGSTSYYGGLSFDDSGATRLSIRNSYDGNGSIIGFGFGSSADKVQIIDGTGLIVNEGNVGIGTTSPGAKLEVKPSGDGDIFIGRYSGGSAKLIYAYQSSADGFLELRTGADTIVTKLSGYGGTPSYFLSNVGIGTTNPVSKLHVVGPINIERIGVANVYSTVDMEGNFRFNASDGYAHTFLNNNSELVRIMPSGNVGIGTTSPATALDVNGTISVGGSPIASFSGNYNRILRPNGTVGIYLGNATDAGNYYDNTTHYFRSSGGGTTYAVINYLGNVGIGTTSPATKLHVVGYSRNDGGLLLNGSDADYREIIFTTSAASRWNLYAYGGESGSNAGSVLYLARYADNGDYIANVATFLRTNGYVGIATTTPTQQLHVSGNVRVTGAYYDSNNSAGSSGQVLSSTGSGTDWVSLSEITGVDGTGTANYIAKWSDTDTITNSQVFDNGTNVGINNTSPKTKLDVNGAIGFGSKSMSMTDTFAAALTINMFDHHGCYVKLTAFGDWVNHSTIAYLGEFFIQASAGAYNEPGIIIRQVDNTAGGDDIQAQIVDPAGTGTRDFVIQLKATSASYTPFTAYLQYEVRGLYNSVS